jgi:hypothetical protein
MLRCTDGKVGMGRVRSEGVVCEVGFGFFQPGKSCLLLEVSEHTVLSNRLDSQQWERRSSNVGGKFGLRVGRRVVYGAGGMFGGDTDSLVAVVIRGCGTLGDRGCRFHGSSDVISFVGVK